MNLYLICYSEYTCEITNYDWFVWANDPKQAKQLWVDNLEWEDVPDSDELTIWQIPTQEPTEPKLLLWHKEVRNVTHDSC